MECKVGGACQILAPRPVNESHRTASCAPNPASDGWTSCGNRTIPQDRRRQDLTGATNFTAHAGRPCPMRPYATRRPSWHMLRLPHAAHVPARIRPSPGLTHSACAGSVRMKVYIGPRASLWRAYGMARDKTTEEAEPDINRPDGRPRVADLAVLRRSRSAKVPPATPGDGRVGRRTADACHVPPAVQDGFQWRIAQ